MEIRSLRFIAAACGGELLSGSPAAPVYGVCTDSRQAQAGDLFIALAGERFDGHDFVPTVARQVAAVLVERGRVPADLGGCAVIAVDGTRAALGRLAAAYRRDFEMPIVVVGGSNGKTTTKELVAAVLGQKLETLASEASFNNDIGVPLTLLRLETKHQAAVLEAGTNHPGELAPLVRMIGPNYGIITSIGREHLEFFGGLAGVAQEEGSLAELLPAQGKLFIDGDSEWASRVAERTQAAVVRVGSAPGNHWRLRSARPDKQGTTLRVQGPSGAWEGEYRINLLGRHQALNALFAVAMGMELGLNREQVERGLARCQPAKMRMQLFELKGVRLLDDAYNANPDSMAAALETLRELPCKGRRVAVLGDMAELGPQSEASHDETGRRAAELGVDQLFAVGRMASALARGARAAGLSRVLEFADVEAAAAAVKQLVKEGDVVLVKASRATRLERVSELLRAGDSPRRPDFQLAGK